MSGKQKVQTTTSSTRADIPAFLKPYLQQAVNISGRAMGDYESMVGDLINQMPASGAELNAQATQGVMDWVGGNDPDRELALKKLRGITGGRAGRDLAHQYNNQGLTEADLASQNFNQQPVNAGVNATFQDLMQRFNPNSAGVQASADASIRAAQPYIYSGFGKSGGVGATKGGLAQVAMQQAASDAFAKLYDNAEQRRLGAATGMSAAEAQKAQAAAMAAQAAAARNANKLAEKRLTADLMAQERRNQITSAGLLSGAGMQGVAALQGAAMIPLGLQDSLIKNAGGAIPGSLVGQETTSQTPYKTGGIGSILGGGLALASLIPGAGAGLTTLGGLLGGGGGNAGPQSAQSYVNTFYR